MISNLRETASESGFFSKAIAWVRSEEADWFRVALAGFLFAKVVFILGTMLAVIDLGNQGISEDLLTMWHRDDSLLFMDIVDEGYKYIPGGDTFNGTVVFFPLYPLLVSIVKPVVGSTQIAGMIIGNIFLFPALVAVYFLANLEFKSRAIARRAVAIVSVFPGAYYYSQPMTESLFLMLLTFCIYFARRRMWFYAAVSCAFIAATRPHGIFLIGFVGLEWLAAHGWKLSKIHRLENWKRVPALFARENLPSLFTILLISPLGILLYMLFLTRQFNDPFAFSEAQWAWKSEVFGIDQVLYFYLTNMKWVLMSLIDGSWTWEQLYFAFRLSVNVLSVPFAWVVSIFTWRKLGLHYAIITLLLVTLGMVHTYYSLLRYVSVVVPISLTLAYYIKNERLYRIMIAVMAVLHLFLAWKRYAGEVT